MQVLIHQDTKEKKDIINFYNEVFIRIMKEHIISSK